MLTVNENKKWFWTMVMVLVCLVIRNTTRADWPQQDKLLAPDGAASDLFGISASIDGNYAVVGAQNDDDNANDSGSAYIFKRDPNTGTWSQQQKLLASDGTGSDFFGTCVSISGDQIFVGAAGDDANAIDSGSAYIFKLDPNTGTWSQQQKLLASDGGYGDSFGFPISISSDYAIIGANLDDNNGFDMGSAYIFRRDPNTGIWSQQQKLLASDGANQDQFGFSASIDGDYAVVGSIADDDNGYNSGSAYIFKRDSNTGTWSQQQKLLASDGAAEDGFSYSVSISGDQIIVGARFDDDNGTNSGSAYIFKRDPNTGTWSQQQKLLASDGAAGDDFGLCVFISGDRTIVGAPLGDGNAVDSGSAYIFRRRGTSWIEVDKLFASDGTAGDQFGSYYTGVFISGEYAIVGAFLDDDNGINSGSAYIFKRVCPVPDLNNDCWVDWKDFAIMADMWLQGS